MQDRGIKVLGISCQISLNFHIIFIYLRTTRSISVSLNLSDWYDSYLRELARSVFHIHNIFSYTSIINWTTNTYSTSSFTLASINFIIIIITTLASIY